MALNIKNGEVERLVAEVSRLTGETKTEAVRRALVERRDRLSVTVVSEDRETRARRFLETEVWPKIPPGERGRRLGRAEEDAILGYGPDGV
ncbi:MAG: type II toxin-antitoxin system VapB family antitoxin [Miltoncostaeaceae bacterium]